MTFIIIALVSTLFLVCIDIILYKYYIRHANDDNLFLDDEYWHEYKIAKRQDEQDQLNEGKRILKRIEQIKYKEISSEKI